MADNNNKIHFEVTGDASQAEREFAQLRLKALRAMEGIEDETERLNAKLNTLSSKERLKINLLPEFSGRSIEKDIDKALSRDALRAFTEETKKGEPSREKMLWQIDQLRIGGEQLGRGSFGGIPNLLKAWAAGTDEASVAAGALSVRTLALGVAAGAAVIGVGFLIKGMVDAANAGAKAADALQKLEDQTGLSADRLQYFKAAATVTNVELESITKALGKYRDAASQAQNGNAELASIFKILGQNAKETSEDAFQKFIKRTSEISDESLRAKVETEVFGGSVRDLARSFRETSADGGKLRDKIQEFAQLQSGDALKAAQEYSRESKLLGLEFDQIYFKVANFTIPILRELAQAFRDLLSGNAFGPNSGIGMFDSWLDKQLEAADRNKERINGLAEGSIQSRKKLESTIIGAGQPNPFAGVTGFADPNKFANKSTAGEAGLRKLFGGKGGGGGAKDIKEIEVAMQALKNEIAEAERSAQNTIESVRRLFDLKSKLLDLELQLAEAQKLPNQRAKAILEVEGKRNDLLAKYNKELGETSEPLMKQMEATSKSINEANREGIEIIKEQDRAYRDLLLDMEDAEQRTRAIRNEAERIKVGILADSNLGKLNPRVVVNKSANAAINGENLRTDGFALGMDEQRNKLNKSFEDNLIGYDEYQVRLRALHAQEEAERERHKTAIEAIEQERINSLQRISPLQEAFNSASQKLFGEGTQAAVDFAAIAGQAFDSFASGMGDIVEQWVLLGSAGPDAMRKLTASVLAGLAKQAAVKAIYYLAEGIAAATNPLTASMAPGYFAAAAKMGAVAAIAGVAGRAIAGDSFKGQQGAASGAGGGGSNARPITIDQGLNDRGRADKPVVIHLRGEYQPGIIVKEVKQDYERNGAMRETFRGDIGGEGRTIV